MFRTAHSRRGRQPEKAVQATEGSSAQHKTAKGLSLIKCIVSAAFHASPCWVGWGMAVTNAGFASGPQPPSNAHRCDKRPSSLACKGSRRSLLPSTHLITHEPNYSLLRRLILKEISQWKYTQTAATASNKCKRFFSLGREPSRQLPQERTGVNRFSPAFPASVYSVPK